MTRPHPDQKDYNRDLAEIEAAAHAALREQNRANHIVTARRVKEAVLERSEPPPEAAHDVLEFAKENLEASQHREQFGTLKNRSGQRSGGS